MRVSDYMSEDVVCANLRDGLHQTFFRMRERGIRHMPVIDDHNTVVGIITDRDLRRPEALVDDGPGKAQYFRLDNDTKVGDAMTPDPATVTADTPLSAALAEVVEHRYGAMPVIDDGGKLIGLLSAVDLLRAFQDSLRS